jgi:predicted RNA binding protein YcfA (HicA-like mRNA interferase family)
MNKLPVISGAECVKALEQVGFSVDRQRGSHSYNICCYSQVISVVPTSDRASHQIISLLAFSHSTSS